MAKDGGEVQIQLMPVNKIKLARNSRVSVSAEELDGLMSSIKEVGLLQPIGVSPTKAGGYEVCFGNRRFLAVTKLGLSKIPVIVQQNKRAFDGDIKNLTENIQRRNLGLAEVGRYIGLLRKEGLTTNECAVRLGVSRAYVQSCISAYEAVPAKYRGDIEMRMGAADKTGRAHPGKIAMSTVQGILSAKKSYRLDNKETETLFAAAKREGFTPKNMQAYAAAVKQGKDPIKSVTPVKQIGLTFFVEQDEYDKLHKAYVEKGPFNSVSQLALAILKGEKSAKIKIVDRK